ncbi:unnamed protein product [Effrenium voratum]|uniref:Uncharacterized protein n=1 Tax=Effrenium voratum TaxID=2562239 RepID=A0AA36I7J0_9DINO|nr:unnamed protein product [Effrenium voratum]CAJ1382434.1 unnamed protein product [Effrenium voratum]
MPLAGLPPMPIGHSKEQEEQWKLQQEKAAQEARYRQHQMEQQQEAMQKKAEYLEQQRQQQLHQWQGQQQEEQQQIQKQTDKTNTEVKKALNPFLQGLKNAFSKEAKEADTQAQHAAESVAASTNDVISSLTDSATNAANDAVSSLTDSASHAANDAMSSLQDSASHAANDAMSSLQDSANHASNDVASSFDEAANNIANEAASSLSESAAHAADQVHSSMEDAASRAREAASSVSGSANGFDVSKFVDSAAQAIRSATSAPSAATAPSPSPSAPSPSPSEDEGGMEGFLDSGAGDSAWSQIMGSSEKFDASHGVKAARSNPLAKAFAGVALVSLLSSLALRWRLVEPEVEDYSMIESLQMPTRSSREVRFA